MLKPLLVAASMAAVVATIPLRAEIVEQVVVKVNGEIITKTEFEARQVAELRNRPELAKASAGNAELQRAIAQIVPDLILNAVDELLMVQRGRESVTRSAISSLPPSSRASGSPTTSRTRPVSRKH
jgi:sulfur carrier protein ThiS